MIRTLILMFLLGFTRQEFPGWFCDIVIYRHIPRGNLKVNFLIYLRVDSGNYSFLFWPNEHFVSYLLFSL